MVISLWSLTIQTIINDNSSKSNRRSSSYKEHRANALASGAEEGRDKLRKAAVRSKYPFDPQMSECGNTIGFMPNYCHMNKIVWWGETR